MLDVLLTYDDSDKGSDEIPGLDYFFEACAYNFYFEIADTNLCHITEVNGEHLTLNNVNSFLNKACKPFLIVAYSHGSDDSLLCKDQSNFYIKSGINDNKFSGCIFYTWSCLTGKLLGKTLLKNNCLAYIGYEGTIIAGTGEIASFLESANFGIKLLMEGKDIKQVIYGMYEKYNELIDYHENDKQDFVIASFLRRNRDELVYFGDDNLSIESIKY